MAAVFAFPQFDFSMLPTARAAKPPAPIDHSAKLQQSLDTLFPDLLLHGTRNCLLNATTHLTKVSGGAHGYFSKLSQALAFDRMMRNVMQFTAAMSPFALNGSLGNWTNPFLAAPQAAPAWGFSAQMPKAPPANPFLPAVFQAQASPKSSAHAWDAANPFFAAACQPQPAMKHEATSCFPASWGIPASWGVPANPFFPDTSQPAPTNQAAAWADYNTLMIVPMAMLAALPELKAMWGLGF